VLLSSWVAAPLPLPGEELAAELPFLLAELWRHRSLSLPS